MNSPIWLPALLVFFAAVLATVSIAMLSELVRERWQRREVTKRMKPVLSGRTSRLGRVDLVRQTEAKGFLESFLGFAPGIGRLERLLEQSRLDWSAGTLAVLMTGLGLAFGFTVLIITSSLPIAALALAMGGSLPLLYVSQRRKARFKQFEEEFPEAIDLLTRAIRAGHPLSAGLGMVADEGPPEVAIEFRRAFEEQRFGIPFEEALLGIVDRTDLVDVRIFAIAVLVQREVGGNLAEILENLAHTVRRRFYVRRQLKTYTAQGRMTGYTLAALPLVVGFSIFLMEPEYMRVLFTERAGKILVLTSVVLQILGALWIRKIIRIDI